MTYNTDIGWAIYTKMGFNVKTDLPYIWKEFIKYFNENHAPMFPCIEDLFRYAKSKDKKLALGSANSIQIINPFIKRNSLEGIFDAVVTTEDAKDKKVIFRICVDRLKVKDCGKVISIADTQKDVLAAEENGMIPIAIGYGGFCSVDLLRKLVPPHRLILFPEQLLPTVMKYF